MLKSPAPTAAQLDVVHLRRLAEFRYQLRRFLHVSQAAAEKAGLRNQQYQMLQCVGGMPEGLEPTIANVAARMLLKHNSTVELVDRTIQQGLLRRVEDVDNLVVSPGDLVTMLICSTDGAGSTSALVFFGNQTSGVSTPTTMRLSGTKLAGNSAEWVVETPVVNGVLSDMPDYGQVFFSNCEGYLTNGSVINGGTGNSIKLVQNNVTLSTGALITPTIIECQYGDRRRSPDAGTRMPKKAAIGASARPIAAFSSSDGARRLARGRAKGHDGPHEQSEA